MEKNRASLMLTSTTLCAALYAVGCYITSYIVSPWGVGQFRPAVVVPAVFAVIFGPMPAGIGAAIGTLIADSANIGSFNVGSLIAAVPGNFFGFYLIGWMLRKRFTWRRFIIASNLALIFANLIVAVLYVGIYMYLFMGQLPQLSLGGLFVFIIGLTIWWFVTMLPFMLLVAPPLIRAAVRAFPYLVPEDVQNRSLRDSISEEGLATSLLVPGILMLVLGLAISFTTISSSLSELFGPVVKNFIEIMTYLSGGILVCLGLFFYFKRLTQT